ncbi:uncharacterized protein LOC108465575 [Gossypium arboreum]|uniref:uncharacterized protein LOC108465575 n=1 Tax=Gossypium arboreum TaxID=29729 RepID=UPI0008191BDE|nr:uncharacterized protein LOC108465575 [Gossypium arboreum]
MGPFITNDGSCGLKPCVALYGHKCRTPLCWTELGKRRVLGPELVSETEDKVRLIWDLLRASFDRQKSYEDMKMRDIEYSMGDFVFLKVSPWKKVLRFKRKGKLSPRIYWSDPSYVVLVKEFEVRLDLTFEEEPVQILD